MASISPSTNFSLLLWTLVTIDVLYISKRGDLRNVAKALAYYHKLSEQINKFKAGDISSDDPDAEIRRQKLESADSVVNVLRQSLARKSINSLSVTAEEVPSFLPTVLLYESLIRILMIPVDKYGAPLLGSAENGVFDNTRGNYSFADVSEYLGCVPEAIFRLLLESKGVLTEKESISKLWDLLPKDHLCLTFSLPPSYTKFSRKGIEEEDKDIDDDRYFAQIQKRIRSLQWRERHRQSRFVSIDGDESGAEPTKGHFVGLHSLRVQVPLILSSGLNLVQTFELANRIYGQNIPRCQFSREEIEKKWYAWRENKPAAFTVLGTLKERMTLDFLQDLTQRGISFKVFMDLIKQMKLDFEESQVKRIYDTMDINIDGTLDKREMLEGFELLMGEHMPELVMTSIGFSQLELLKRKLSQFAFITLISIFLTTAFYSIIVETSSKDSVTQSFLVLAGTFGVQALTAEDIESIRKMMRTKISVIFGDISHISSESTEAADLDLSRRLENANEMARLLKIRLQESEQSDALRVQMSPKRITLELPDSFVHSSFSMNLALFAGDNVVIRPKVYFEDTSILMQRSTLDGRPPGRGKLAKHLIKQSQQKHADLSMSSDEVSESSSSSSISLEDDDEDEIRHEGQEQTYSNRLQMKWECHPAPPANLGLSFDPVTGVIEGLLMHKSETETLGHRQLRLLYPTTDHTITMRNPWGSAHATLTFEIWGLV